MELISKGPDTKASSFKLPDPEQLNLKRLDPAKLEIKKKLSKGRLALIRAGREDRKKYQARANIKKKTGGRSNKEKKHVKAMPHATKKAKWHGPGKRKKKLQWRAGKQFRGKKAWK